MSDETSKQTRHCISHDDVLVASKRIVGKAHQTPVLTSSSIDSLSTEGDNVRSNRKLFFKVEAFQKTGSFKFRGALNATLSLLESRAGGSNETEEQQIVNVVTHSSGNHAQALALAASVASPNVRATIVMPRGAPAIKKAAVESYGGEIILVDNTNEARESKADEIVEERKAEFIHPSEDPRVIAGQGTVCYEFVQQVRGMGEELDAVIIPVGGGGLASGNAVSLRGMLGAKVKIILAEPSEMDDAYRSFATGVHVGHDKSNPLNSVADGLKTTLGPNTWPIVRDLVDDIITVTEEEILRATKLIWERLKVCIEPSAGVGVAVAMGRTFRERYRVEDGIRNVGIVLCGGNVDVIKIAKLMGDMGF